MFFCHGSKHSKGTVIMFNPSLDVEIIECTTSEKGRTIILEARFDDTKFIFVNIYAPNDLTQQVKFFDSLKSKLVKFANESIIVGGDFNCALTPSDKKGGYPIEKKGAAISNICRILELKDAWRCMQMSHCLLGTISLPKSAADWTIFWSRATSLIRYKNAR